MIVEGKTSKQGHQRSEHYKEYKPKKQTWTRSSFGPRSYKLNIDCRRGSPKLEAFRGLLYYDVEEMDRFRIMYVGYVKQLGTSYRIHDWFSMQGFFSVKITPIGETQC